MKKAKGVIDKFAREIGDPIKSIGGIIANDVDTQTAYNMAQNMVPIDEIAKVLGTTANRVREKLKYYSAPDGTTVTQFRDLKSPALLSMQARIIALGNALLDKIQDAMQTEKIELANVREFKMLADAFFRFAEMERANDSGKITIDLPGVAIESFTVKMRSVSEDAINITPKE